MPINPLILQGHGPLTIAGRPVIANISGSTELWVDLPNEYYVQGNITKSMSVNLTGMPSSSSLGYFTMLFDARIWGSTGGQARIIIENSAHSSPMEWTPSDVWGMRDHFVLWTPPNFYVSENAVDKVWNTDTSASSLVTVNSYGVSSTLWPENTYKPFKMVCDRSGHICHIFIDGTYLGYVSNFSNDLITWNMIFLYSDQGRDYEIAAVRNIKVAGFSNLQDAMAWEGI